MIYPQFDQLGEHGIHAQQDAEECLSLLLSSLTEKAPIKALLEGELTIVSTCKEAPEEAPIISVEPFLKLNCHIEQSTGHLTTGLRQSLTETLEKDSPSLNRLAQYEKESKISKLPLYLMVHFIRFFWKQSSQVKAKILKKVSFPMVLDTFPMCTEDYQASIKESRDKVSKQIQATGISLATKTIDPTGDNGMDSQLKPSGYYDLIAVLTHVGRSADAGHYIAWVKDEKFPNVWWKFDDEKVSETREEDILKLDGGGDWHIAYLCFYKAKMA